jgi:hypothetical protein
LTCTSNTPHPQWACRIIGHALGNYSSLSHAVNGLNAHCAATYHQNDAAQAAKSAGTKIITMGVGGAEAVAAFNKT